MNITNSTFFEILYTYLNVYLARQRGYSSNTITSYKSALNGYISFVAELNKIKLYDLTFDYFTAEVLVEYLDYLENKLNYSISSRNQRLFSIRSFFRYVASQDASYTMLYNNARNVCAKRNPKDTEIEFFSESALKSILSIPDPKTKKGLRDLTFMIVLYDTGARVQELLDISPSDIQVGKVSSIKLIGKGGKPRIVPLMDKTMEHIDKYNKVFHPNSTHMQFEFYTVRKGVEGKISQDTIYKSINSYAKIARETNPEVPEHIYPHMFRHSRAMHLYRGGMPLPLISEWLGHAQMQTTIKYYANANLNMKQEAIKKATSAFSPLLDEKVSFSIEECDDETFRRLCGLV